MLLNLCEFRNLHVFLFGKIIVVSIPDNVLQSQIRKKNLRNVRNCSVRKIFLYCIGNEILPRTSVKKNICATIVSNTVQYT